MEFSVWPGNHWPYLMSVTFCTGCRWSYTQAWGSSGSEHLIWKTFVSEIMHLLLISLSLPATPLSPLTVQLTWHHVLHMTTYKIVATKCSYLTLNFQVEVKKESYQDIKYLLCLARATLSASDLIYLLFYANPTLNSCKPPLHNYQVII